MKVAHGIEMEQTLKQIADQVTANCLNESVHLIQKNFDESTRFDEFLDARVLSTIMVGILSNVFINLVRNGINIDGLKSNVLKSVESIYDIATTSDKDLDGKHKIH